MLDSGPLVVQLRGLHAALDLVDLLVILVGPHVGRKCGRQGIERDLLQAVAERRIAQQRKQMLQRVHVFDHGAQLGALRRVAAGQTFVAGKHAGRHAVIAVQLVHHVVDGCAVALIAADAPPERRAP